MQLRFVNPGFAYSMQSIMLFQTADASPFWSGPLFDFFPQLSREKTLSLPADARKQYIAQILEGEYAHISAIIDSKIPQYADHWTSHKAQIEAAFSDAFGLDCTEILNDMVCRVTLNPIAPRFLREHTFDVFYLNSEKGALGMALHEITHFVWFHVWHALFGDSWEEYETPSLKWIFSEMVVESILRDERLSSINPYFPGSIYPYFFTMKTEDGPILDMIDSMYRGQDMHTFMKNGFAYCKAHETAIRAHIHASEN